MPTYSDCAAARVVTRAAAEAGAAVDAAHRMAGVNRSLRLYRLRLRAYQARERESLTKNGLRAGDMLP